MKSKINGIISEELENLLNELIDPNGGNTYYPQGLDPKVVKLFEDFVDEAYEDVSEIQKLASEIIKEIAKQNYSRYNKNGSFDTLYGIHLSSINHKNYKKLSEFIENTNIQIYLLPKKEGGDRGAYGTYMNGEYNPSEGREIEIYLDFHDIKKDVDEKIKRGQIDYSDVLYSIHYKLFSPLVHELQHAYDDYRSKNKIYQSKEYKEYLNTYMKNKVKDELGDDIEQTKKYLNLPHEIWARFSQAIQNTSFFTFDIDEKNEKLIYSMNPIKNVVYDFRRSFVGFHVLSEKMKKKLINKVVQFWHYEQDQIPEKNRIGT